jgi:AcrR family transcriptional regulator
MLRQRRDLIEAGLQLFAERGFDETSINDIVERVEVSPRTFFRYFKTKEELVFQWNDANGHFAIEVLEGLQGGQPTLDSMKSMFILLAERMDKNREQSAQISRLIFDSATLAARAHHEFAKWENAFIVALQKGGRMRAKERQRVEVEVAVAVTAFVVAVRQWCHARATTAVRPWVLAALEVL